MLDRDMLRAVERSVLCWLATVDSEGQPSVSPKEIFAAIGDARIVIANIASPGSQKNLLANPSACVSLVDLFVQKGYKFYGKVKVVRKEDERFEELSKPLVRLTEGAFPIQSVLELEVESVQPILAPSYLFVPGTTEEGQIASAMDSYQVRTVTTMSLPRWFGYALASLSLGLLVATALDVQVHGRTSLYEQLTDAYWQFLGGFSLLGFLTVGFPILFTITLFGKERNMFLLPGVGVIAASMFAMLANYLLRGSEDGSLQMAIFGCVYGFVAGACFVFLARRTIPGEVNRG
ncbi:MAG: pyridoxamine 5'-phosphate oxidase family protein [Planctomycetota bacterium]